MRLDIARETRSCPKGHGEYESRCHDFEIKIQNVPLYWTPCPECERLEQLERKAAEKRIEWEKHIERLVTAVRIPQRFCNKTFDDFKSTTNGERRAVSIARDYADRFDEHFTAGRCLTLCGRPGTGKTHLGCAIGTSVARSNRRALYTTVSELIRRIRSTWRDGAFESERDILREIEGLHLLILDELGVQLGGNAELVQLSELIDLRYRANRPTLVITNSAFNELGHYLGDRGADRLKENGGLVAIFDWQSYRGKLSA